MAELNFHHLRYFWAVAHEGNLTRAAETLHVSQSAVSVQIKKLEQQVGHELFERRGRRLVLTEAGRITLDYADTVFDLGDELLGTLGAGSESTRRVLRVGSNATLSRNFQIGFLQPLLGRDDVELILRSGQLGDLLRDLESYRFDVVLANVAPIRESDMDWIPHLIAEQPVSLVGTPERLKRGRRLKDILANEPLLLPTPDSSVRIGFDTLVDRMGVRPRIAGEIDDMAMLRLLARESAGLAVVPPIVVRDELKSGILVEIRRLPELREPFYAITPSRRFPNPLLRELIPEIEFDA
ncbi:MAG: LysR family transcriptional regulator [Planctomycetota bacterium]